MEQRASLQLLAALLLLPANALAATAAAPTFSPAAGTYSAPQAVSLSSTTPGAKIYYTTNGTAPSTSSPLYTAPITISSTQTVKALAAATGYTNSAATSATYTITTRAAAPTFSPAAGTYATSQSVTLTDSTAGAKIYYTTDGSTPSTASTLYSGPIAVTSTTTLKAIAAATGYSNSAVATAAYAISPPAATPTFSPAGGAFAGSIFVTITDATLGATIYFTTDGTTPTTGSKSYSGPIAVTASATLRAIATAPGYLGSTAASATYTITPPAPICFTYDAAGNMSSAARCP